MNCIGVIFGAAAMHCRPLPEYFRLIDDHFEHRVLISQMKKELDARASQFRVVEKRMLTRFKDKTPTPLAKLDTLLNQTYDDVRTAPWYFFDAYSTLTP